MFIIYVIINVYNISNNKKYNIPDWRSAGSQAFFPDPEFLWRPWRSMSSSTERRWSAKVIQMVPHGSPRDGIQFRD